MRDPFHRHAEESAMNKPQLRHVEIMGDPDGMTYVELGERPTPQEVEEFRRAYDLGMAWAEAEAALPEGWSGPSLHRIAISGTVTFVARASSTYLVDPQGIEAEAAAPAAALRALAAKLREQV
jgi:hypothetical protein